MASTDNNTTGTNAFDPLQQNVTFLGPDGKTPIAVPLPTINDFYHSSFAQSISVGTQLGALFTMLAIVLVMTPRARYKLPPTLANLAALVVTLARVILLSLYYVSDWQKLFIVFSGDYSSVPRIDYNLSIVATAFSVPTTVLIQLALIVQAWSMLRLWREGWRYTTAAVSLVVVLLTVGFNLALTVNQITYILYEAEQFVWVQQGYVILLTISICWFAFLFIARMVLHMCETRSILPRNGHNQLNSMDALVLTNGLLMIVPG